MNLSSCLHCIYYNILSNFYVTLSTFLPGFEQEIISIQYKIIECINEDYVFAYNSRKRKRFNIFVENLVQKNNEFIEKIRLQEQEDNDIKNYDKINENDCEYESSEEESSEESSEGSQDSEGPGGNDVPGGNEEYVEDEEEETIYEADKKND